MSIVSNSIINADAEARYLSPGELDQVAGDVTPIEEIGVIGAKELYRSLGTPLEAMAEAVREMKIVAMGLLTGADAEEAGTYFDYVVGALA
ncbi:MAG: hypothetical protein EBZ24_10495 [Synechococcaceae bacterium WB9_4xB_025]|nr:hypothetical protein [Synechococcaceae bacterium WB9_4xB_025]